MSEVRNNAKALDVSSDFLPDTANTPRSETSLTTTKTEDWPLLQRVFSFPAMLGTMLVGAAFVVGCAFDINPDFWWHAKTGETILATHQWPTVDPFSFTAAGRPWLAYEWFGDVLFAEIARKAGLRGLDALLILLSAAILAALYTFATLRCRNSKAAFVSTAVLMVLASQAFTLRPQMLGFVFLILTLTILERLRQGNAAIVWCLPPLFLLWINTHGSWIVGLATVAIVLACGSIRFDLGDIHSETLTRTQIGRLGLALILCLVALPITPYGLKLAAYPFEVASSLPLNLANVTEWRSMSFQDLPGKIILAVVLGVLILRSAMRMRWRLDELVLFVGGAVLACIHVRFLLLFVPFAAPVLAGTVAQWIPAYDRKQDHSWLNAALMASALTLMLIYFPSKKTLEADVARMSPVHAVEYLRGHAVPGPMFATYEFGDYLVWAMAPATPVFIDGRGELYEREGVLADYLEVAGVRPRALEVLRARGVQSCLLRQGEPLITLLAALPDWRQIYADDVSVLFERTISPGSPSAVGMPKSARLQSRDLALMAAATFLANNTFRIRSSERSTRNPFKIRTSKTKDLYSFRIRPYEISREGG
jgi:hypothetical protein